MRIVGLDIHRVFAQAVMLDSGGATRLGRVGLTREHLEAFARELGNDDHVVVEATGNAAAKAEVIAPHVGRVIIANPRQVRLIAEARIIGRTQLPVATLAEERLYVGFHGKLARTSWLTEFDKDGWMCLVAAAEQVITADISNA